MNISIKPNDEVIRIDYQRPGEITFWIRRADKALGSVTLNQVIWTNILEIGFPVEQILISDPDPKII